MEQLSIIGQIIEKNMNIVRIFGRFLWILEKHMTAHKESLYNIMEEFGIPNKLISLTKMCMEGTKYQVRVDIAYYLTPSQQKLALNKVMHYPRYCLT